MTAACARRTLAAATSFMASVIFWVFFTEAILHTRKKEESIQAALTLSIPAENVHWDGTDRSRTSFRPLVTCRVARCGRATFTARGAAKEDLPARNCLELSILRCVNVGVSCEAGAAEHSNGKQVLGVQL